MAHHILMGLFVLLTDLCQSFLGLDPSALTLAWALAFLSLFDSSFCLRPCPAIGMFERVASRRLMPSLRFASCRDGVL